MGSRRLVGFALGEHHDAALVYAALARRWRFAAVSVIREIVSRDTDAP